MCGDGSIRHEYSSEAHLGGRIFVTVRNRPRRQPYLALILELEARADRRVDVRTVDIPATQPAVRAAVHGTRVHIEVHIEAVVGIEGQRLDIAAAGTVRGADAAHGCRGVAVGALVDLIIRGGEVQVRNDRVAHAGPVDPDNLR